MLPLEWAMIKHKFINLYNEGQAYFGIYATEANQIHQYTNN